MGADQTGTLVTDRRSRGVAFARLLSSAVMGQTLLSAASFGIGLILIRHTTDVQYGYFILASSAIILLVSLQNAFFNPPLVTRMTQLAPPERGDLVGGLYREQRRLRWTLGGIAAAIAGILWYAQILDENTGPLVFATIIATLAILNREYFRMVLLAHKRPQDVLRTDTFYVVVMVAGVFFATRTQAPAVAAILVLGLAGVASGILLSRSLHRHEPWNTQGVPHILAEIAPLAAWSTAGAAIHWSFSQGYTYLVAGTRAVAAVAAIAATRLLVMPINLLSSGIGTLMLPLASGWLNEHGASVLWRRLMLFGLVMAGVALCYFATLWVLRDWIFDTVLNKQFAQRDQLLILWSMAFLVMVVRDQLIYLLVVHGRFRFLTSLAVVTAVVSLSVSYLGMLYYGTVGALLGILTGELINVTGIILLSFREARHKVPATAKAQQAG